MREGNAERGFTLIELLVVVAIIAILAAVVIPNFMTESTRGKAKSEVAAMLAELSNREDQYKLESATGTYVAAATCPPAASRTGTNVTTQTCLANWTPLRVNPTSSTLTCAYTVAAGLATDATAVPSWVTAQGITTPAVAWYHITAVCPEDEYFTASWDTKTRSKSGK